MLKGGPHDLFLTRADTGRDQDCTTAGLVEKVAHRVADLLGSELAGTLHLQQQRCLQEEDISQGREGVTSSLHILLYLEVFRVMALDGGTAGIVVDVVHHALQVVITLEDAVMEAPLPQGWCRIARTCGTIHAVTPHLEARNHMAQVTRNSFTHVEDEVKVVRHQLLSNNLDSGIMGGNFLQLAENSATQWRGMDDGFIIDAVARDACQQGTAVVNDQGNHVDTAALIVMASAPALHRGDRLTVPTGPAVVILRVIAHRDAKVQQAQ